MSVPIKEIKLLAMASGGICAFPDCGRQLVDFDDSGAEPVIHGKIAHIVARSRQGPRGAVTMTDDDRDRADNLLLLCGEHHDVIDARPTVYSVPVLRQVKADHERRVADSLQPRSTGRDRRRMRTTELLSSVLPLTQLPGVIYSAPCAFGPREYQDVKRRILYPKDRSELVPFALSDKRLFAFQDLGDARGPFSPVVDSRGVDAVSTGHAAASQEPRRLLVQLLNRSMHKYAARRGLAFDPDHRRYYFPITADSEERQVVYTTLQGRQRKRRVVWRPVRKKTGEARGYWIHIAAGLAFHQLAVDQWCLTVRPEYRLTADGVNAIPSDEIGKRITRLKSRMYNWQYLLQVHFWRSYLLDSAPRLVLDYGRQHAIIDWEILTFRASWPDAPSDDKRVPKTAPPDDLFSSAVLARANMIDAEA